MKRTGHVWDNSVPPSQFCFENKIALKIKSIKKFLILKYNLKSEGENTYT